MYLLEKGYNTIYYKCTGTWFNYNCDVSPTAPVMGKSTCSYKEFQEGKFQVEGMPDGVPFKTPGSYGLPCLRKIIDAKEHIQCKSK